MSPTEDLHDLYTGLIAEGHTPDAAQCGVARYALDYAKDLSDRAQIEIKFGRHREFSVLADLAATYRKLAFNQTKAEGRA